MIQYDPQIIHKFATSLYSRARMLVIAYTLMGILIGASAGKTFNTVNRVAAAPQNLVGVFGLGQPAQPSLPTKSWTLTGILVAGLIGFWTGWNKASILKLQAQTALCQMKIEENTRSNIGS